MVERTGKAVHRTVRVRDVHGAITSEAVCVECGNEIVATAGEWTFLALGDLSLLGGRKVEGVATTGWVLENKVLVDLTLYNSAVRKLFVLNNVIRAKQWNGIGPPVL